MHKFWEILGEFLYNFFGKIFILGLTRWENGAGTAIIAPPNSLTFHFTTFFTKSQ